MVNRENYPNDLTEEEIRATDYIQTHGRPVWLLGSIPGMDTDADDNWYYVRGGIARKWSNLSKLSQDEIHFKLKHNFKID